MSKDIHMYITNYNLHVYAMYLLTHRLSNGANGQSNLHGGSGTLNLDRNVGASAAKMDEVNE
jgi:hypothetical protein